MYLYSFADHWFRFWISIEDVETAGCRSNIDEEQSKITNTSTISKKKLRKSSMKLLLQPKRIKNKNIYYSQWIEWIFFQFLGKSSSLAARFSIQSLNSNRSDQIK